ARAGARPRARHALFPPALTRRGGLVHRRRDAQCDPDRAAGLERPLLPLARPGAGLARGGARARGRARCADHADASRRALLRLCAAAGRRLFIRAGVMTETVRNSLKERLARGEVASSMTVRLSRSVEIAQVAATAGFDSLYIDLEHSSLSLETTSQICSAALTCGIAPLVRVAQVELIQRVLDGGALGVIAPDVRNAAQAREIVRAAKYPPQGERGFASVLAQLQYRTVPTTELYTAVNDATMVIVQFESAEAIDRADEIFAVDGVD